MGTPLKGTQILGGVVPFNTDDSYSSHFAKYGHGGWRTSANLGERNSISLDRRENLMTVAVESNTNSGSSGDVAFYYLNVNGANSTSTSLLDNNNWIQLDLGEGWVFPPPPQSSYTGTTGQKSYERGYFYICVEPNLWQRTAIDWFVDAGTAGGSGTSGIQPFSNGDVGIWDSSVGNWRYSTVVETTFVSGSDLSVIYTDGSTSSYVLQSGGTAGGASNFIDLLDVPGSYSGQANKLVRVNPSETGLEFFFSTSGATPIVVEDTFITGQNLKVVFTDGSTSSYAISTLAVGNIGDIQRTNGSGGFVGTSVLNYSPTLNSIKIGGNITIANGGWNGALGNTIVVSGGAGFNFAQGQNINILAGGWNVALGQDQFIKDGRGDAGIVNNNAILNGEFNTIESTTSGTGVYNSVMFGFINDIIADAGTEIPFSFLAGIYSKLTAPHAFSLGYRSLSTGWGAVAWGDDASSNNPNTYNPSVPMVLAQGRHSFNFSGNTIEQNTGEGALGNYSVIMGGLNHNIPINSPYSVMLGGTNGKARANDHSQVYVPNFNILKTPINNDSLSQVLVRDSVTGQIKYRNASSISGTSGGSNIIVPGAKGDIQLSDGSGGLAAFNDFNYINGTNFLYVPNINITNNPIKDVGIDQILGRNSSSGEVGYIDRSPYITDSTLKAFLSNTGNWVSQVCDTTALTVTGYVGQRYFDNNYIFECYQDGFWIKTMRL